MASAMSGEGRSLKYDAFLNFRGADTRHNFVSHLYDALRRKGITTFMDHGIQRAEDVSSSLLKAIEESRSSIVIFSKNYAASPWCLDELVKILECKRRAGQRVLPVFYDIDPSEVNSLRGSYGEALSQLKIRYPDKMHSWADALRAVSNLSGLVSGDTRPESLLVHDIVTYVSKTLPQPSCNLHDDGLIGIDSRVRQVESLLCLDSFDTRIIGIWGMGGIGKTTIAKAVFDRLRGNFDNCCFFTENLRKSPPLHLERESLCDKTPTRKKVLIVLDDVDKTVDFNSLLGGLDRFAPGSRIIVTSRDRHVLEFCRVNSVYEVQALNNHESLQLLCLSAFKGSLPLESYRDLLNRVTTYAKGLPLALKICGSYLFGRSEIEWESALNKLQTCFDSRIQQVLCISYDKLDNHEKEIFLDIACFFRGQGIDRVKEILYDSGFDVDIGIASLLNKSLISIFDKKLEMHDLLQHMGRQIVRQESASKLGSRSRLWDSNDIYQVLAYNQGTEAVRGINLDVSRIRKLNISSHAFTKMRNLKFLKFYTPFTKSVEDDSSLYALEGLVHLPASLRLLHWQSYPSKSLPSNFDPSRLVDLNLCFSNLELLWEGTKCLHNLKRIDLSHSKRLVKMPDFSLAPNLESMSLESCSSLSEVHSSIQHLNKLAILNLKDCIKLKSLSITTNLVSLEMLNISGCSRINKLGGSSPNIKSLFLDGTVIRELPQSIQHVRKLVCLSLKNCKLLKTLPSEICNLQSLKTLNLLGCSRLENFPEILEPMKNLEILRLDGTAIREVPKTREMDNLKILSFGDCNLFEIPNDICRFSSIEHLNLSGNNFSSLPLNIKQMIQLKLLDLSSCTNLRSLPELPSHIEYLNAHDCTSLENVSIPSSVLTVSEWSRPMFLFTNCFKLDFSALLNSQFIHDQGSAVLPSSGICFPGSKIPEQISHQSVGCSMAVSLPEHWINGNFRGFALAAVLGFKDYLDNHGFFVKCKIKLRTKHEENISLQHDFIIFHGRSGHWNSSRILGSDHVFLSYNHYINLVEILGDIWQNESCHSTALFDFYAVDSIGRPLQGCEVRECGFSLQLAEDENEYNPSRCYY
ncbi:disease resistance-like protein DSC1 [Mercurialis annua]|uniref:disease resistance-like protein DSC1 n=1 Tax=Mercurialis annua TaxID=3986 RepID=UPI00215F1B28|nr:disease resistance-like protein DSC1 [Mercurialis annua]